MISKYELLRRFVEHELKLKYVGSLSWVILVMLEPTIISLILLLVFTKLFSYNMEEYPSYLLIGTFVWTYFSKATIDGLKSLEKYSNLIKKTPFPRAIIPLGINIVNLIDFLVKIIILIVILLIFRYSLNWPSLINLDWKLFLLIIPILILFALITLLSYLLSLAYTYLRVTNYLWGILLGIGFFITPIIYPITIIPSKYHFIFTINPLTYVINLFRSIIIRGQIENFIGFLFLVILLVILFFIIKNIFNKFEKEIGEIL